MKKQLWIWGCAMGMFMSTFSIPTMANTTKLVTDIQYVDTDGGEIKKDAYPEVKITIPDAYKNAGKSETITIKLIGAEWDETNNVDLSNLTNIRPINIGYSIINSTEMVINVDLASTLEKGDEVSFTVPIAMRAYDEEVYVKVGDGSVLMEDETILVAANEKRKLTWKVGEVPSFVQEGTLAPITFTEINKFAMGSREAEVTIKLQDDSVAFGDFDYTKVDENKFYTEYTLDTSKYIEYNDGFIGADNKIKLRKSKEANEITIFLKGKIASTLGSITVKNLPIYNTSSAKQDKKILATFSGDALAGAAEDILVAYQSSLTEEEKVAAEKEAEKAQQAQEEADRKAAELEALVKSSIRFTVGESFYTTYGRTCEMDGTTYIEEPGYTMVPIRYVAEALGIYDQDISYVNGQLFFSYNGRNIQLTTGSNIAIVNRATITMSAPVVLKEGRSYAPMGEVAKILGLTKEWDSTTQTAIFYK